MSCISSCCSTNLRRAQVDEFAPEGKTWTKVNYPTALTSPLQILEGHELVREVVLEGFRVRRLISCDLFTSRKGVFRITIGDKAVRQLQLKGDPERNWRISGHQLLYYGNSQPLKLELQLVELDDDDRVALERLATGLSEVKKIAALAPPPYNAAASGFDVASAAARYAKHWVDDDTELLVLSSISSPEYVTSKTAPSAQIDPVYQRRYLITRRRNRQTKADIPVMNEDWNFENAFNEDEELDLAIYLTVKDYVRPTPTDLRRLTVTVTSIDIDTHIIKETRCTKWFRHRTVELSLAAGATLVQSSTPVKSEAGKDINQPKKKVDDSEKTEATSSSNPFSSLPPIQILAQCEPEKYRQTVAIDRLCIFHGDWPAKLDFFLAFKFFFTDKKTIFKDGNWILPDNAEKDQQALVDSLFTFEKTLTDSLAPPATDPKAWSSRNLIRQSIGSLFNIAKQFKPSDKVFFDWDGALSPKDGEWKSDIYQYYSLHLETGAVTHSDSPISITERCICFEVRSSALATPKSESINKKNTQAPDELSDHSNLKPVSLEELPAQQRIAADIFKNGYYYDAGGGGNCGPLVMAAALNLRIKNQPHLPKWTHKQIRKKIDRERQLPKTTKGGPRWWTDDDLTTAAKLFESDIYVLTNPEHDPARRYQIFESSSSTDQSEPPIFIYHCGSHYRLVLDSPLNQTQQSELRLKPAPKPVFEE